MPLQTVSQPQHLPRYFSRLALGLLVLTLTLLLLVTAVGPGFSSLVIDEACETAAPKRQTINANAKKLRLRIKIEALLIHMEEPDGTSNTRYCYWWQSGRVMDRPGSGRSF